MTDEGKEALRIMATKETIKSQAKGTSPVDIFKILTIVLVVVLGLTLFFSYYNNHQLTTALNYLNQSYGDLNQSYYGLSQNYDNLNQSFHNLAHFTAGLIGINSSISPPISEAQAVQMVFNLTGLNEATLINKSVTVQLDYVTIVNGYILMNGATFPIVEVIQSVTEPVSNYSPVTINGTTYYYAWVMQFSLATFNLQVISAL